MYLALVQNVSRFGADDSGGDADADDVESVCDDIRQKVSHVHGLPHLLDSGRLEPRARV